MKSSRPTSVPQGMRPIYEAVAALTDAFCRERLNEEYQDLARAMIAALCRKRPSPLASGQPRTWACGVIHVLGQHNFLSDKATQPYMAMAEVAAGFGVGQSTASAKGAVIRRLLNPNRFDPNWSLRSLIDQNPLTWMLEINGILMDVRRAPQEIQELALAQGLIPHLPNDEP